MGTMTAQILVGHSHQNHGGIIPKHSLFLSENSRPAWVLTKLDLGPERKDEIKQKVTWIPTHNMLEDALLMISIYVTKEKKVKKAAQKYFSELNKEKGPIELYEDISEDDRQKLYELNRELDHNYTMAISVFDRRFNYKVLEEYSMNVFVCTTDFKRMYSAWQDEIRTVGDLDKID